MPEGAKPKNKKRNKGAVKPMESGEPAEHESSKESLEVEANDALEAIQSSEDTDNQSAILRHGTGDSANGTKPDIGAIIEDPEMPIADDKTYHADNGKRSASPDILKSNQRLDALVRDRDTLRAEVIDMRKSLEGLQSKHRADMAALQENLENAESKKEHAESQFQKLLERVNTIKSQLGERLREDAEELAQAKSRIEELEGQNLGLQEGLQSKLSDLERVSEANNNMLRELSTLRDRTNLSQQNWLKEKEEILEQENYLQTEFEQAKEAMHNWEVLAMEERSIRENLGEKVIDLEEQLVTVKGAYEKAASDLDSQVATVDGLQRALQEIQAARKQELRELVESSDIQLEELKKQLHGAEKSSSEANKALQDAQNELERVRPFEKEVKEKNLLIGKLRHEAVTLNDHLTKALRFLKKGKAEDNVDRHIVTNHLLHFLALDRSDPKKFQILQLIAALLGWTDEQREQAGLSRPGTSSSTMGKLRVPSTPVHRTPSSQALATEFLDNSNTNKESLAELWSNFLEQESQAAENIHPKP
ncbi:hypothetical protein BO70DRAFT_379750 [Aspergillus heteromorphus CBS 117.55]|uniref:GRIP domain-containing protein n=1 Tax=Aspergillus heteromorphus CBS 117.55 TaxID=1448321 RepID=A0A317W6T8_9EURO|nr:uncharacterized protein BO70DRAFT_379750 [Aspergillus heteromorphus CBS 117.55]PWY81769.1 hypothetical protein BO70DRAFT_379750 [Aspergillus heteromorphus CBS 117.55]